MNRLHSLKVPLGILLTLAVLVTSLAVYLIQSYALEKSLMLREQDRAANSYRLSANLIEEETEEMMNLALTLAGQRFLQEEMIALLHPEILPPVLWEDEFGTNPLQDVLTRIAANLGEGRTLSLIDRQAQMLFQSQPELPVLNLNSWGVSEALSGEALLLAGKRGGNWEIRAVVPVRSQEEVFGALLISVGLDELLERVEAIVETDLFLLNFEGIQADTGGAETVPTFAFDQTLINQVLEEKLTLTRQAEDGLHLYYYRMLRVVDEVFCLVIEEDLGPARQLLAAQRQETLLTTLAILLVTLLLCSWLGTLLLRPLSRLRRRVEDTAGQLTGVSLPKHAGDEVNSLVQAFDGMVNELKSHEARIQQEYAQLEVMVAERTGELKQSNLRLQQAQQKSLRLQQFLADLIDSMPSALIGVSASGMIVRWNRKADELTGLQQQNVLNQPLFKVLPQLTGICHDLELSQQHQQPQHKSQLPIDFADRLRLLDVMIYPLTAEEEGGAVIRLDDVTERVRLDELMIQTEKMMSVGGLAAGMAHEINNPLAGIIQNAQVLLLRFSAEFPKNLKAAESSGFSIAQLQDYLARRKIIATTEAILEAGRRAGKIVENMLSFSRQADTEKSPQRLNELIERSLELAGKEYDLSRSYDFQRILICKELAADLPSVNCSASQLQQVLLNLFKNGAQAMAGWAGQSEACHFIIRTGRSELTCWVEIEDNGPGMDDKTRRRIFEPFFTTKEVGAGTGLGLSVSYFIITENHGGSMEVESEPGQGAKFIIHLPIAPAT